MSDVRNQKSEFFVICFLSSVHGVFMTDSLLASMQYGSYVSLVKFVVFLLFFFVWLPIVAWVYRDAKAVRTKENFWSGIIFATGTAATGLWLLIPTFAIGTSLYLIAVGATFIAYVMHRNARVAEFQRVLTIGHIKSLFSSGQKETAAVSKGMVFITANGNQVAPPPRKTPESYGYKFASQIFDDALARRVSDIAFVPAPAEYNVAYRIDGLAFKQPARSREEMEYFIRFVKHLADLDVNEHRKPQKGRFTITKDSAESQWEVSTAGSTTGERVQVRQIEEYTLMKLESIGLHSKQAEQVSKIADAKGGIFLISGPRKTGVTTTLYACLRSHDPFMANIHTLERQPAAELMNITQNVYSLSDTGITTFARKLQSVLRTGPDIVGVGDCRDADTARLACNDAKRAKLFYVCFQAASVVQALAAWIKWVGDKNLVAETLLGISNQRLLRKICQKCKQAYQPNKALLKKFNIPADRVKRFYRPAETQYDKRGRPILCENCQSMGYVGRTGVFEIIIMNDDLRNAIRKAGSFQEIATQFRRAGMLYMQEQAMRKVVQGTTSINEVIREFSTKKRQKQPEKKS